MIFEGMICPLGMVQIVVEGEPGEGEEAQVNSFLIHGAVGGYRGRDPIKITRHI